MQLLQSQIRSIQIRNKASILNSEANEQERDEFSLLKQLYVSIPFLNVVAKAIGRGTLIHSPFQGFEQMDEAFAIELCLVLMLSLYHKSVSSTVFPSAFPYS